MTPETAVTALSGATRWMAYVGGVLAVGACGFRFAVLTAVRRCEGSGQFHRRASQIGLGGAMLFFVASLSRIYVQTYVFFGSEQTITVDLLRTVVFQTRWGSGWMWQFAASAACVVAYLAILRSPRLGWPAAILTGLAICATSPLTGHAMSHVVPWQAVSLQALHLAGSGLWLGTLVIVFSVIVWPPTDGEARPLIQEPTVVVNAFSRVALAGCGLLVVTGCLTTWLYIDEMTVLWTTAYGQTLLTELGLFLAVASLGAYNWRRLKPHLGSPSKTASLLRSVAAELVLAGIVLAVTAFLVGLPLLAQ